jgi:hypothetical protein
MTMRAFLQAPPFLYRFELARTVVSAQALALDGHALASRLSYLLAGSMPDQPMIDAADGGKLTTRDDVAREARRLLRDPRARELLFHFHGQWLQIGDADTADKDAVKYPRFPTMAPLFREEFKQQIGGALLDGDGTVEAVLGGDASYMSKPLADFYGAAGPKGAGFEKVALDPARRLGILTQGAVMSAHATATDSSIVRRGKFVREQLLCLAMAQPPPDVPPLPSASKAMPSSQRQRLELHTAAGACGACHQLLNPPGYAFEHFGASGEWRDADNGAVIDTATEIRGTADVDGPVGGAAELARKLARSAQVRDCAVTQWFRFALGREEGKDDDCALRALRTAFTASKGNVRELLVAIAVTDAFLAPPNPGGAR